MVLEVLTSASWSNFWRSTSVAANLSAATLSAVLFWAYAALLKLSARTRAPKAFDNMLL